MSARVAQPPEVIMIIHSAFAQRVATRWVGVSYVRVERMLCEVRLIAVRCLAGKSYILVTFNVVQQEFFVVEGQSWALRATVPRLHHDTFHRPA